MSTKTGEGSPEADDYPTDNHRHSVPLADRIGPTFVLSRDGQSVEWMSRPDAPDMTVNQAMVVAQIQSARLVANAISELAAAIDRLADASERSK